MVRLLHYSKEPLKGVKSVAPKRQGESFKPKGLWVSEDDAWKKWVSQNKFYPEEYVIENEILLEPDANMLHISKLEELHAFTDKVEVPAEWTRKYKYVDVLNLDWESVANSYDGILIMPYIWGGHSDPKTMWYYGWDIGSGCIWNADAVKDIVVYE